MCGSSRMVLSFAISGGMFASGAGVAYLLMDRGAAEPAVVPVAVEDREAPPVIAPVEVAGTGVGWEPPRGFGEVALSPIEAEDDVVDGLEGADEEGFAFDEGFGRDVAEDEQDAEEQVEPADEEGDREAIAPFSDEPARAADDPEAVLEREGFSRQGVNYILADEEEQTLRMIRKAIASREQLAPLAATRDQILAIQANIQNARRYLNDIQARINDANRIMNRYPNRKAFRNSYERDEFDGALQRRNYLAEEKARVEAAINDLQSQLPSPEVQRQLQYEIQSLSQSHQSALVAAREDVERLRESYRERASRPGIGEAVDELKTRPGRRATRIGGSDKLHDLSKQLVGMEKEFGITPARRR